VHGPTTPLRFRQGVADDAAQELRGLAAALWATLDVLDVDVPVARAGWTGRFHEAFVTTWSDRRRDLVATCDSLLATAAAIESGAAAAAAEDRRRAERRAAAEQLTRTRPARRAP
jgi:uncharacterized protein YukE